jgi:hypothetical protein
VGVVHDIQPNLTYPARYPPSPPSMSAPPRSRYQTASCATLSFGFLSDESLLLTKLRRRTRRKLCPNILFCASPAPALPFNMLSIIYVNGRTAKASPIFIPTSLPHGTRHLLPFQGRGDRPRSGQWCGELHIHSCPRCRAFRGSRLFHLLIILATADSIRYRIDCQRPPGACEEGCTSLGRERAAVLTRSRNAHCSCPYSLYNSRDGDAACCKHYDGACGCRIALLGSTVNPYAALDHSGHLSRADTICPSRQRVGPSR